jgi:nitrite reductase (NADH) small subunit
MTGAAVLTPKLTPEQEGLMDWIDIGALEDIPERGARVVKTQAGCVALFRTGPEEVFATADACPHRGGPLSEGIVHGRRVTCPLHSWVFDLESGAALGEDARLATYAVRIVAGRVLLDGRLLAKRSAA